MSESTLEALVEKYLQRCELGTAETIETFLDSHPGNRAVLARMLADDAEVAGALSRNRELPKPGDTIGGCRLTREIARGGMGILFEAVDANGVTVALKLLLPALALSGSATSRFERERRVTARLWHPGIVTVHADGHDRGFDYIVMERLGGGGLDAWIAARNAGPRTAETLGIAHCREAAALIAKTAEALEYAHRCGVIHRDVKPSNVLLRDATTPVLTDFGLAREEGLPSLTTTGDFAGTPYYVSPEQALGGRGRVDDRSDVYSLGATLYEMLTFEPPFPGTTAPEVFAKVVTKDAPDPRLANRSIPRPLAAIVVKALERDPDRRFASAAEFAVDLTAWLDGRPTVARPLSPVERWRRYRRAEPARATILVAIAMGAILAAVATLLVLPGIRSSNRRDRLDSIERALDQGLIRLVGLRPELAQRHFDLVLSMDPTNVEARAGRCIAVAVGGHEGDALATARREASLAGAAPAWNRIARSIEELKSEPQTSGDSRPASTSSFEHFVDGVFLLTRGMREMGSLLPAARDAFGRAVATATLPRLGYVFGRAQAAYYVRDASVSQECAAAARALWPDQLPTTWCHLWDLSLRDPKAALVEAKRSLVGTGLADAVIESGFLMSIAQNGDRDFAREIVRGFSPPPGEEARYAFRMGTCLFRAGEWSLGVDLLRRAAFLEPQNPIHHYALGCALVASVGVHEGLAELAIAHDLDPCNPVTLAQYGEALVRAGQTERGLALCSQALRLAPDVADVCFPCGMAMQQVGRFEEAEKLAERSVRLAPALADGWCQLAAARVARNDVAGAEAAIHSALIKAEPSALVHTWLARLLGHRKDYDAALAEYRLALTLEPENGNLLTEYAPAAIALGEGDEGQAAGEKYAALVGTAGAWNDAAWLLVDPSMPARARDPRRGHDYARLAVAKDPTLAPAHDTLAWALYYLGRYDEARVASDRAMELATRNPRWASTLGLFEESHARLERALFAPTPDDR